MAISNSYVTNYQRVPQNGMVYCSIWNEQGVVPHVEAKDHRSAGSKDVIGRKSILGKQALPQ